MGTKRFYQPSAAMTTPEGYEKVVYDTGAGPAGEDTPRYVSASDSPDVVALQLIQTKGVLPKWTTFTARTQQLANGVAEDVFPGSPGVFVQPVFRNLGPNDITYAVNANADAAPGEGSVTKICYVNELVEFSFMTDKRVNIVANGVGGALVVAEERS